MKALLRPVYKAIVPKQLRTYRFYFDRFRRNFGMRHAPQLCRRFLLDGGETTELPLPGFPAPLVLRRGTSDASVFECIFLLDELREADDLAEPKLILDLGAYTGLTTAYLARRHPGSEIVAVEPEVSNFAMLVHNTAGFDNVSVVNKAIWSQVTRLKLKNPIAEKWGFQFAESDPGDGILTTTIDELLQQSGKGEIDFIKMNIEGAESELFSSGDRWLPFTRSIWVDLHEHFVPGVEQAVFTAAERHGFNWYRRNNVAFFWRG